MDLDLLDRAEPGLILSEHSYSIAQYKPLFVQRIEKSLSLDGLICATEDAVKEFDASDDDLDSADTEFLKLFKPSKVQAKRERGRPSSQAVSADAVEKKLMRQSLYCTGNLKYKKKWLRDLLLSDSDSAETEEDDDPEQPISEARFKQMLKEHLQIKKYKALFSTLSNTAEYKEYTYGVLGQMPFPTPLAEKPPPLKKKNIPSLKPPVPVNNTPKVQDEELEDGELVLPYGVDLAQYYSGLDTPPASSKSGVGNKAPKSKKPVTAEILLARRKKVWHSIVKKDIAKAAKARTNSRKEQLSNARKCAVAIMKQKRKEAILSQKAMTSLQTRMKRICRDVAIYWKRFEKVEKQQMKKVQKEAEEQRKQDMNLLEAKRQARKLNFLITQTELYAHFMAKKITGASEDDRNKILSRLDEKEDNRLRNFGLDDYNAEDAKSQLLYNVEDAYEKQTSKTLKFDASVSTALEGNFGLDAPVSTEREYPQPSIFVGKLKTYQIKGMNWLANLYSQGINGILADEMGLGKTVQSIAFLAHLAEIHGIWGPFLVVAPASTLHNWQQECSRFLPKMRVVPYWGTTQERKILRKFWDQKHMHTEHASFHIVITSYQLVIQDCKYFSKVSWHYMVLDEAQALKSSSSARWKTLLSFNCRNRLLLTGTPIQNSMAELWALLHFIMPTLFDSHDEFNEWFSKDIENHVENKSNIDQNHLSRLHMILKPFMLRRIKKDVENDLTDKIEVLVYCPLTMRQRYLYDAIKRKIRIEDLLAGVAQTAAASNNATNSLMNLVMQFRKVCNHPELFERRDIKSPAHIRIDPFLVPKLVYREGVLVSSLPSRQHILLRLMSIYRTDYTHQATSQQPADQCGNSLFSWIRLINMTSGDLYKVMMTGLMSILNHLFQVLKEKRLLHHSKLYGDKNSRYVRRRLLLVTDEMPTDDTSIQTSQVMSDLIFTSNTRHAYSHLTHCLFYMKETSAHKKIRLKLVGEHHDNPNLSSPIKKQKHKPTNTTNKHSPTVPNNIENCNMELGPYRIEQNKLHRKLELQLTDMPHFLNHMIAKASCAPHQPYCYDRSAQYELVSQQHCGSLDAKNFLLYGPDLHYNRNMWRFEEPGGLEAVKPPYGFSNIYIPDKRSMIVDAGKMHVLDELLTKLKKEGHRVLIYSTMTKVIDLLEEFMHYRKHQYMRLDGSSKISERRDMVSDFQSKHDIFVFLLSTRAGGLGINLTAADTVIFYDSDWNPTVDAQAMDRAHRLGQTKQVTVYRLICKGTIEERILERAKEKSEIQRMVITGHNSFRPDVLKPKEVVSLLIDDEALKQRIEQAQESKGDRSEKRKLATSSKKVSQDGDPVPKKKRGRKSTKNVDHSGQLNSLSPAASTPVQLSSSQLRMNGTPLGEEDSLDIDTFDGTSSRASSPVISSAPSTPSLHSTTPSVAESRKGRGRPKGSVVRNKGGRTKNSAAAALRKALTAAEIAGTKAGMNAAYAAYGLTVPPAPSPVVKAGLTKPT